MNPIKVMISCVGLVLLFTGYTCLAASNGPVCVPGDTKCLHPKQPMTETDWFFDENIGKVNGTYINYDEDDNDNRPYYNDNDEGREEREHADRDREGEREHEWREEQENHERQEHQEHHDRGIHIEVGR